MHIVLEVIKTCLPQLLQSSEGKTRMKAMIPTYDEDIKLPQNAGRFKELSRKAEEILSA